MPRQPEKPKTSSNSARRGPDSRAAVARAVKQLRDYHMMGTASLAENPDRVAYATSSELLRKARVFARTYSAADLNQLTTLCEKHQTALGRSFLDRLSTIKDKSERKVLERRCILERWSRIQLDRELRKRYGRRVRLGRAPQRPETVTDALADLLKIVVRLDRWRAMMDVDDDQQVTLRCLPAAVRRGVAAVEQLAVEVEKQLVAAHKRR